MPYLIYKLNTFSPKQIIAARPHYYAYPGMVFQNGPTFDIILQVICEEFDISKERLMMRSNKRDIVYPRHLAQYFARELTQKALWQIGEFFGFKDHATVVHSHRLIKDLMDSDKKICAQVTRLKNRF